MAPALRPVPFRPPGPVDPDEATRHVGSALPHLDEEARRALALVEVAGRPPDTVAAELSLDSEKLGAALYRARKALRRSGFPLSSTGWCERAERLLSDALDGVLAPPGPARLQAHLRHCGRCVEHERRLAQARESLVRDYAELHGPPEPEPEPEDEAPAAADLRIVPEAGLPALEAAGEPRAVEAAEEPLPVEAPAALQAVEAADEPQAVEAPQEPEAVDAPEEPQAVEAVGEPAAVRAAPAPAPVATAPSARVERVVVGVAAQGSALWSALHLVAIALAVVSVVLTVLAATGSVERLF